MEEYEEHKDLLLPSSLPPSATASSSNPPPLAIAFSTNPALSANKPKKPTKSKTLSKAKIATATKKMCKIGRKPTKRSALMKPFYMETDVELDSEPEVDLDAVADSPPRIRDLKRLGKKNKNKKKSGKKVEINIKLCFPKVLSIVLLKLKLFR